MAHYLDTSALVKLVFEESETDALRAWLGEAEREPVTCDLARTELVRAVRRVHPDQLLRARAVLDAVTVTAVDTAVFEAAGRLDPTLSSSSDAIHLAAALDLGDDLAALVTYDERLGQAAAAAGVTVLTPA